MSRRKDSYTDKYTFSPGVFATPVGKRGTIGTPRGRAAALGTSANYSTGLPSHAGKIAGTADTVRVRVDQLLKECGIAADDKRQRRHRYYLQEVAASLLQKYPKLIADPAGKMVVARTKEGAERTKFKVCLCGKVSLHPGIARAHVTTRSARYKDMVTCGSVWVCPVCSSLVSVRRREEIVTAVDAAPAQGQMVFLMTLTARHSATTSLRAFYGAMTKAHGRFWSGGDITGIKAVFGIDGMISDREVTFSRANGAHPHIHELVFLRRPVLSEEQIQGIKAEVAESVLHYRSSRARERFYEERLAKALQKAQRQLEEAVVTEFDRVFRARWERVAAEAGLDMDRHGFDVSNSSRRVAEYVAKHGHQPRWRDADELTKWHRKLKHNEHESYTPWQLLELASQGDEWAAAMFCEYALVYFGKRQVHWSKGLKHRFGLDEKTDEELAVEASDEAQLRFVVDAPMAEFHKQVIVPRVRAQYLELCELGEKEAIIEAIFLAFGFRPFVVEYEGEGRRGEDVSCIAV